MPILDLQKRARELGRIRLGKQETFTKRDGKPGTKPVKLDRFRFTGHSEALITKVAELYGGEVQPWTPAGGAPQFEVISTTARVPIMVPPQPVSQWYEYWTAGGCKHRCDGRTNVLTDEPCDPEDFQHNEAVKKPTTRLNVVLRDVEGIGVWRVETHGFNAAIELPDVAEFLAQAGGYVNGWLSLEQRTSIDTSGEKPLTRHFMVPIIEVDVTPAQLMAGHGRVAAPALAGGPVGQTPALAAAGPDYVALAADLESADEIRALWLQANSAGHMTKGLSDYLAQRAEEIKAAPAGGNGGAEQPGGFSVPPTPDAAPDADGVVDAEIVEEGNADAIWQQILAAGGERGYSNADLNDDFAQAMGGLTADSASAAELAQYLQILTARPAA